MVIVTLHDIHCNDTKYCSRSENLFFLHVPKSKHRRRIKLVTKFLVLHTSSGCSNGCKNIKIFWYFVGGVSKCELVRSVFNYLKSLRKFLVCCERLNSSHHILIWYMIARIISTERSRYTFNLKLAYPGNFWNEEKLVELYEKNRLYLDKSLYSSWQ